MPQRATNALSLAARVAARAIGHFQKDAAGKRVARRDHRHFPQRAIGEEQHPAAPFDRLHRSAAGALLLHLSIKLSAALVAFIAVRGLSVSDFGLVLSLQAYALVAAAVWDAGLSVSIARGLASGDQRIEALGQALWARATLLVVPVAVGTAMYAQLLTERTDAVPLLALFAVVALAASTNALLSSALQGTHRYFTASVPHLAGRSCAVIWVVGATLWARGDVVAICFGFVVGELVTLAALVMSLRPLRVFLRGFPGIERIASLLRGSFPFALNSIFILLYNKFDVNLARFGGGPLVAGFYAPASRMQDLFGLLPAVLVTAAVPVAAARSSDPAALRLILRRLTLIGLSITIPAAIVIVTAAELIVDRALGPRYGLTSDAVRVLAVSLPFVAFSGPRLAVLVGADRGRATAMIYGLAFAVSAIALVNLSGAYGVGGAALGALCREPVLAIGSALAVRPVVRRRAGVSSAASESRQVETG